MYVSMGFAEFAMPVTMRQFDHLGVTGVMSKLISRRYYLLALRMCEALGTSTEEVMWNAMHLNPSLLKALMYHS